MRQSLTAVTVLIMLIAAGCGGGGISVSGKLLKGGEKYTPPDGRKLAIYFYPVAEGGSKEPVAGVEMAQYNESDGSFTVPGRNGSGIAPRKYRIVVSETMRRETRDRVNKGKKRGEKRIDNDTNFLESSFGVTTSPFVRELKSSTTLTLDMASPQG